MNLYQKLRNYFSYNPEQEKASQVGGLIVMNQLDRPVSKKRNSDDFAREAYQKIVVAYASINLISDAVSSLEWQLFDSKRKKDRNEITNHEILDLIERPNPKQSTETFFKALTAYLLIAGDTFIEGVAIDENAAPKELWTHRPSRFSVIPGALGLPSGYEFKVNSEKKIFPVDQITGRSKIAQISLFNPLDDWYGQTPLEAASNELDQLAGLNMWNLALINNSGRPSGAFIQREGTILTNEQREDLREDIDRVMAGGKNAGRPIVLQGMEWKEMSLSPKDMDFMKSKQVSKSDVALAFGVPGQLIGIESSMKFKNMEEAKLHFWNHTVIPLSKLITGTLNHWLAPSFGDNLFLDFNRDAIEALEPQRAKRWEKAQNANFLTVNEKRELVGKPSYEPTGDPGDQVLVNQSLIPLEEAMLGIDTQGNATQEVQKFRKLIPGDSIIEGKVFNINTEAGKRKAYKAALKKRAIFERRLNAQIKAAFSKERKNLESNLKGVDPELMSLVVNESIDQTAPIFRKVLESNIRSTSESFGKDILQLGKSEIRIDEEVKITDDEFSAFIKEFVVTQALSATVNITETTKKKLKKQINKAIEEGESEVELTNRLLKVHKGLSDSRARTIASTEVHIASNEASRKAAKTLSIDLLKEWISDLQESARGNRLEDETDHINMNGIKIKMNEQFEVLRKNGTDLMDGPGDPKAPVRQLANCKCTLIYQKG